MAARGCPFGFGVWTANAKFERRFSDIEEMFAAQGRAGERFA
jgi:hypothetical protein